ncbi:MAG: hypothetical protein AB8G22_02215 [Saprospiraceae bacterium]
MNYNQNTEHLNDESLEDENGISNDTQMIESKEKSILDDPIFYAALVVVGIAGFLITRKTQQNIQRKRVRASRRFRGTDFTPRNGQFEWEEEEVGIGS